MPDPELQRRWEAWVDSHLNSLLLFAKNQCQCESDAEDLVQQALAESWKQGEPSLPLAYTIIRHRAVDLARRTVSREKREWELWHLSPAWLEPEVLGRDDAALVARELSKLSSVQREVVLLHVWAGLSFREIGEVLGIPLHTAASRYRTALASLRPGLQELNPNKTL